MSTYEIPSENIALHFARLNEEARPVIAHILQARLYVDDKAVAVLSVENAQTGSDERPTYRVTMDFYKELRVVTTELKDYERQGKTRLDLIADAMKVIAEMERT